MAEVLVQARSERGLANWSWSKFSDKISFILVHSKSAAQLEKVNQVLNTITFPAKAFFFIF